MRGVDAAAQVLGHFGIARNRLDLHVVAAARPFYQVGVRNGRLRVEGSSPVAVVRGAYAYLNRLGLLSDSWEGKRAARLAILAD